ncbi:MAG: recombinase RecT [Ignavibacteriota bacterium]
MSPQNEKQAAPMPLNTPAKRRTIAELLQGDEMKKAVAAALPRHLRVDRFIRVALTATLRNPDLLECTRESLFQCLLDLSSLGLEPDGRRAHLIPFNNKVKGPDGREHYELQCTLIIDYKGISDLVRRSGDVSYIHADVVYEKDEFSFCYGSGAYLKHIPNMDDRGEKVRAIYSFVKLRDGSEDFIVMSKGEVEKVRNKSKAPNSPAWSGSWGEMAKKTVFRRHSKWLPLSPESREAVEHDDEFTGADFADAIEGARQGTRADQEAVAEAKIAQMEAERQEKGLLAGETPADRDARQERQMEQDLQQAKQREARIQDLEEWPDDPYATSLGTEIRVAGKWYRRPDVNSDRWRELAAMAPHPHRRNNRRHQRRRRGASHRISGEQNENFADPHSGYIRHEERSICSRHCDPHPWSQRFG